MEHFGIYISVLNGALWDMEQVYSGIGSGSGSGLCIDQQSLFPEHDYILTHTRGSWGDGSAL